MPKKIDLVEDHLEETLDWIFFLAKRGIDLDVRRQIEVYFEAHTEADAIALTEALSALGLSDAKYELVNENTFTLIATIEKSLNRFCSKQTIKRLVNLATQHNAKYKKSGIDMQQYAAAE